MTDKFTRPLFTKINGTQQIATYVRKYSRSLLFGSSLLLFTLLLAHSVAAQQCTGSLGDPVFKETFGTAPTAAKPTLGGPLPAGITTYAYYTPVGASRPTGPYPGQYTISNTTRGYNNTYFVDRPDHTSTDGTGYCMVVDAEATPGKFYERTITGLCAGTTFEFSAWIMNINPQTGANVSRPSLRFDIVDANNPNGTPITSVSTGQVAYQSPGTWVRQAGIFQMPSTTNAVILRIFSNTPSSNGNDLALDDIAFAACGPPITFTQAAGIVCAGNNTALSVSLPAGSYSNYFFQLQKRALGTADWANEGGIVNNQASNQRTFPITNARAGFEYRVVAAGGINEISNLNCRVTSSPIELKVIDYTTSIADINAICYNTSTTLTASVTPKPGTGTPSTGFVYQWETSANGSTGWTTVSGQAGATLNTGALTTSRYYRVTATVNGCQGDGTSVPVLVTVNPAITATVGPVSSVCAGAALFSLPYSIASGAPNTYSITAGARVMAGFTPVSSAPLTASPVSVPIPSNAPAGTYDFLVTFSSSDVNCSSPQYPVTLTIDAKPTIAVAGAPQNLCEVSQATLGGNTPVAGTGTWSQVSGPTEASFDDIHKPGAVAGNLTTGTYEFKWTIANGNCPATSSNTQVTVWAPSTAPNAGPDQTEYNSGVFQMDANAAITGTGAWSVASGNATIANTANPKTLITIGANTTATLVWTTTNGVCPPRKDTVVLTYTSRADIRIGKSVLESGPYLAGQETTYEIVVGNVGPSNASNVHVTDVIPADFVVSNIETAVIGAAQILQNNSTNTNIDINASIPVGLASVTVKITGQIKSSFEGNLTNTANAVSLVEPDPDGATSTSVIAVARRPFFAAVKAAPAGAVAGQAIHFSLVVDNAGMGDAQNAMITDVISSKLTNVSWSATSTGKVNITAGATGTGNHLSITANMPGNDTGKVYISINATVNAAATGNIDNTATVTPTETTVPPVNSNTTNTLITSTPGLLIDKSRTSPVIAIAGQEIDYVLTLLNNGPSNAVATIITDTVPATVQNVTWTTVAQGSATVTNGASGNGNIIRVTGNVPAGSSNRILVYVKGTVSADYTGTIQNMVTATPSEPGIPPLTDTDVATVQKSVKLDIQKSGPTTAVAGEQISYTVDVRNDGPSNTSNTLIRDIVPTALENVSWRASVLSGTAFIRSGATGNVNKMEVTADMNAGATIRIIITGTIAPPTFNPIENTAQVVPVEPGFPPVNSNEVVTNIQRQSALDITKTGPDTANAGNNIIYTITAANNGPSNSRGVTITDLVPATIQQVTWIAVANGNAAVSGPTTGTGNNIAVTGDIATGIGNAIVVTVRGKIDPSFSGKITNKAVIIPAAGEGTGDSSTKVTTVNRLPQLTISKVAPALVRSGDTVTYNIQVANPGNADAQNLVITDVVPAALTSVQWTATTTGAATIGSGANGTGNNVQVTASIPAGTANEVNIVVKGKTSPAVEGLITNTATVTPSEAVPPVSATADVRTRRRPEFNITKSGPTTLNAGEKIIYTILVNNIGISDAQNLLIKDTVPGAITQVTWTATTSNSATIVNGGTGAGNILAITANLPGGNNSGVAITVTGTVDPTFNGTFQNVANYQSTENVSPGISNPVVTTVQQKSAVHITKSGPVVANAGDNITYTLQVTNAGPSTAVNTLITDQLPAILQNAAWTATASGGATISTGNTGSGNSVSVTGTIPAKTGVINITVNALVPPGAAAGSIRNFAIATPDEAGMPPANSDTVVTVIKQKSGLLITKIAPSTANAGESIVYGVKVVNVGPSDAHGAVITDAIPATILNPTWMATPFGNASITGSTTGTGNQLTVTADIPAGDSNYIAIIINGTIKDDFAGQLMNTAVATPAEPGLTPVNSTITTTVTRKAVLKVHKSGPANITAGNRLRYIIDVTNTGPGSASNVTISDVIPAGIINATWTAAGLSGAVINSGNTGTGNIQLKADIPGNSLAVVHIEIDGQVDPGYTSPTLLNKAVALNDPSVTPAGDSSSVLTTVARLANLNIVKSGPANAAAGEPMQYILTIRNAGPSNATGVQIGDVLPFGLLNGSWTATGTGNIQHISPAKGNGNVSLTADIPADTSTLTVTINGIVSPALVNGTMISNTAVVTLPAGSPLVDPNLGDNTSTIATVIDNDPIVRIGKTGPAITHVGDSIFYRIVVSNGGSGNITNALIQDMVPSAVTVAYWTATGTGDAIVTGAASGNSNTLQTTGSMPVGGPNTIVIMVAGVVNNTAGTSITNTATVTAGANKSSSVTTSVDHSTDVSIVKSAPQQLNAGEAITYTIQVFNAGPNDVDDLVINDQVPADITSVSWYAIASGNATVLGQGRVDSTGNAISLPAKLAAGSGNYITITVNGLISGATTANSITNTATVTVNGVVDYNPANNSSSATTTIGKLTGVQVHKSGPKQAVGGNAITYSIVVTNSGPSDAIGININDMVPAVIKNVSWMASVNGAAGITGAFSGTGSNISTSANIPGGTGNNVTITVTGIVDNDFEGTIVNTANVTGTGIPPVSDSVVTLVNRQTQVNLYKDGPATVTAGDKMSYMITLTNNGPGYARNLLISDSIDARLQQPTWTTQVTNGAVINTGTSGSGQFLLVNADIPPGVNATVVITITGTIAPNASGTLSNYAGVSKPTGEWIATPPVITEIVQHPALHITKNGPASLNAGQTIHYLLQVNNDGISNATNAKITDLVPAGISLVQWNVQSVSGGAVVTSGNTGTGNDIQLTANMPAGAGIVVSITGKTDSTFAGSIVNSAIVIPSEAGNTPDTGTVQTVITLKPGLNITKTGPATLTAGATITYTIRAANDGPSTATNALLTDQVPAGITHVTWSASAAGKATINGAATGTGNGVNLLATIPPGAGNNIAVTVTGVVDPAFRDTLDNIAIITPAEPGIPADSSDLVKTVVTANPQLLIQKDGPANITAGQPITYTITVGNQGLSNAVNAKITDIIPATITAVQWEASADGQATISGPASGTGNNISITGNIPAADSNAIVITVNGIVANNARGAIINTATVTPSETGAVASQSTVTTNVDVQALVRITKSGPATMIRGTEATYIINVVNPGPSNANDVDITDVIPGVLTNVSWTATAVHSATITAGATGTGNTMKVTANLPATDTSGLSIVITGTVSQTAPTGTVTNTAHAILNEQNGADIPSRPVVSTITGLTDLVITKTGPAEVYEGGQVIYQLTITNNGPSDANGATLNDVLPAGLSKASVAVSQSTNGTGNIQASVNNSIASATLGTFPVGAQTVLQVSGIAVAPGTLSNTAVVNTPAGLPDADSSNNTSETVTTNVLAKSALKVMKTIAPPQGPYVVGQQITYTITATNTGKAAVNPVIVNDQLPAATLVSDPVFTAPVKGTATFNTAQRQLQWNIGLLDAGETTTWSYNIILTGPGNTQNTAVVNGPPDVSTPDTSTVIIPVQKNTDLSITKTGPANVFEHGKVTYVLTINNAGPMAADGATVQDVLPAGLSQTAISITQNTGGAANIQTGITSSAATATIGTFPVGGQVVLQITGVASTSGTLLNTAVVNTPAGLPDADSSNNTSKTVATGVIKQAILKVVKSVSPSTGPYSVGQRITYTITASNTGNTTVAPVIVNDVLPPATLVSDPLYNTPQTGTISFNSNTRVLQWNIGTLSGGATTTWSYDVTITGAGEVLNTATISGPPDESVPDSSTVSITTDKFANLKVMKKLDTEPPLNVGQLLQFTITAINNGPNQATGVVMKDTLQSMIDKPLTINTSKGNATYDPTTRTISWQLAELANGAQETLTFTAKLASGGNINNTATISGNETDVDLTDNTASITEAITGADIFLPNVITPNGDGKNDFFVVPGLDRYPGSTLIIYNRWGNQVYQNKNYDNKWNGLGLNEGTYFYILKLNTPQGERDLKGWVELLR
ncbi:gliding motility-associated C-terminal domain-containing protein [Chitinophaga sp. Ak27]|uniref:DUF7927 domain-containing protein n=1 Tax=Chitinophaga sp. Ak27 TaxID=2726116 RepID=UPI00145E79D7|nr:gliding motility-associated C-terminal domain-containing protein [Chitinophaga sp. Ak27]NLU95724.1 DUF11 domain-containing protein [Chitinophaga sp. Ak27]